MIRMGARSFAAALGLVSLWTLWGVSGCSYGGYVSNGLNIAQRAQGGPAEKRTYYVDVTLDGHEGSRVRNTGDIRIADAVNTSPRFQFTINNAEEFGKVSSVILNIHLYHPDRKDQPFDAGYVIALAGQDSSKPAFTPGTVYDLSKPMEGVRVVYPASYQGERDGTVKLPAGSHFCMTVTVQASRAETARVFFETK